MIKFGINQWILKMTNKKLSPNRKKVLHGQFIAKEDLIVFDVDNTIKEWLACESRLKKYYGIGEDENDAAIAYTYYHNVADW